MKTKCIPALFVALAALCLSLTAHADKRILLVVTNHGDMGDTGTPTGYFLSEVAHPWAVFVDAGYTVDFASPKGGFAPMDPKSFDLSDDKNKQFWHTLDAVQGVTNTHEIAALDPANYDAIVFAGGHGTMWDFPNSRPLSQLTAAIYEAGGVVSAVCHGPAALVNVELSNGKHLLEGKEVAGFTNEEEAAVGLTEVMPFLLEDKLQAKGATHTEAPNFQPHVVVSERLVTGQNPASATAMAKEIVKLLEGEKDSVPSS